MLGLSSTSTEANKAQSIRDCLLCWAIVGDDPETVAVAYKKKRYLILSNSKPLLRMSVKNKDSGRLSK